MLANVLASAEEGLDHFGIPLLAGSVAQDRVELFVAHALAIGTVAAHGVERVGHGNDPRQ